MKHYIVVAVALVLLAVWSVAADDEGIDLDKIRTQMNAATKELYGEDADGRRIKLDADGYPVPDADHFDDLHRDIPQQGVETAGVVPDPDSYRHQRHQHDLQVTHLEIACQACDMAVDHLFRVALLQQFKCFPPSQVDGNDAEMFAHHFKTHDVTRNHTVPLERMHETCEDGSITLKEVTTLVGDMCTSYVNEFPAVEEFDSMEHAMDPAQVEIDAEEAENEEERNKELPSGTPGLDERFTLLVEKACQREILQQPKVKIQLVQDIFDAVRRFDFSLPREDRQDEDLLDDQPGYQLTPDEEVERTAKLLRTRRHRAHTRINHKVYDIVKSLQEANCGVPCAAQGPQFVRGEQPRLVKGWSATGKRINSRR